MDAEIIAIGSELLGPDKLDTNSLYLTERLNRIGVRVVRKTVVGDDHQRLFEAFSSALNRADLVITTGGLGPTRDDITREVVSEALGLPLELHENILQNLKQRYHDRGTDFQDNSARQAYVMKGADPIPNGPGAAPGIFLKHGDTLITLLPGVPREMRYMMENHVLDRLEQEFKCPVMFSVSLNFATIPESVIDQRLRRFDFDTLNIEYTILASLRRVQVTLSGVNREIVRDMANQVKAEFPAGFYGEGDPFLEEVILSQLIKRGQTIAAAESCTGGLLGKMVTDVPGSSRAFLGGVVAYHNRIKTQLLDVSENTLHTHGAVSSQVAAMMASGVRHVFGSDYGIGITGVAGPGESESKPAGLVFVSISGRGKTCVQRFQFSGNREMVRLQSVTRSLHLLNTKFLQTESDWGASDL